MILPPITVYTGRAEWAHIAYRETLHFFGSSAAYTGMVFALYGLKRKFKEDFFHWVAVFLPALVVCFIAFLREPSDVHRGDLWWKSYVDLSGWIIGSVVCAFTTHKVLRKFLL